MAKHNYTQNSGKRTASSTRPPLSHPEPEVRRWPHPIHGIQPAAQQENPLHYIRCSLAYQNQLLADIKSLLQCMTVNAASDQDEK